MSFCNSDPAIPEICFTLFAHFSSHSCCQVCDQLSFPVWFSTSLSFNLSLVVPVPPNCNFPLLFMETGGKLGFLRESSVLDAQMPTNPQHMRHLNTGIDWRVRINLGLNLTLGYTSDVCDTQWDCFGWFW